MPIFEVILKAVCTYVVEAPDADAALDLAWDEADPGSADHWDDACVRRVITDPQLIDSARRHADAVIIPDTIPKPKDKP